MKTETKKPTAKELAAKFVGYAKEFGMNYTVGKTCVTVSRAIVKNCCDDFTKAETEASILLYDCCPHKGGSVWGTDGGSIGGAVAMRDGYFRMCKSGSGGVSFAREVAKLTS